MEAAQRQAAQLLQQVLGGRSLAALPPARGSAEAGERALVQELVYGSLRWWGRIDALLRQLFHRKPPRASVRCLIAVALYQLLETGAPPFAVVDQAVKAAEKGGLSGAKGLVNAVLREFLRTREDRLRALAGDELARYSHPRWWIERLKIDHELEWSAVLDAANTRPPMTLRANLRRCSREELAQALVAQGIEAFPVAEAGLLLARPQAVAELPGFAEGWFSVQDAGAQFAAALLDPQPGMRVLDACAAPGGKTTHLLERSDCQLVALDSDEKRLLRVRENLARLGLSAQVIAGDARGPSAWWDGRPFDRILADVPCSSSGVVRRHPDIKWLRRDRDLAALAVQQRAIAEALWPLLAPGGRMLYASCSVFHAENKDVLARFLAEHAEARVVPLGIEDAKQGQLLPVAQDAAHNHDGFYYALLEKS